MFFTAGDDGDFLESMIYLLVAGGTMVLTGVRQYLLHRKVGDIARSKIKSAPQGLVEIEGIGWCGDITEFDLSGNPCIYRDLELQYHTGGDKGRWVTEWKYNSTTPIYVFDKTGVVMLIVSPSDSLYCEKVTLNLKKLEPTAVSGLVQLMKHHYYSNRKEFLSTFATKQGVRLNSPFLKTGRRLIERSIALGSPVYALGSLNTRAVPEDSRVCQSLVHFMDHLEDIARGRNWDALHQFDHNKDGILDEFELRQGFSNIAKKVLKLVKSGKLNQYINDLTNHPRYKIKGVMTTNSAHKLVVADKTEKHFLAQLGKWNFLLIVAGAALIAVSVVLTIWFFTARE